MMILVCCWVPHDKHIKVIEDATQTTIHTRGEMIQIIGEKTAAEKAQSVIHAFAGVDQTRDQYQYARCYYGIEHGK